MTGFAGVAWSVPLTTAAAFVAASCVACALAQRQARAASLHRFAAGALDGEANAGRRLDARLMLHVQRHGHECEFGHLGAAAEHVERLRRGAAGFQQVRPSRKQRSKRAVRLFRHLLERLEQRKA